MEGVRQRTCRDAHPPRENLSFQEKCWKGVPKSTINRSWGGLGAPGADFGRSWRPRSAPGRSRGAPGHPPGLPRGGPGAARGRPGAPRGHPGGDFGGNFRCFLTVRVRSHLFAQQKHEFSSKFAKFSTCATLRRAIWTRPTQCLLNVSMFAKKRASRLEKPRKTSKILPKST